MHRDVVKDGELYSVASNTITRGPQYNIIVNLKALLGFKQVIDIGLVAPLLRNDNYVDLQGVAVLNEVLRGVEATLL